MMLGERFSHTGVCRSVHFVGRLEILTARSNGGAKLLVYVQRCLGNPGFLLGTSIAKAVIPLTEWVYLSMRDKYRGFGTVDRHTPLNRRLMNPAGHAKACSDLCDDVKNLKIFCGRVFKRYATRLNFSFENFERQELFGKYFRKRPLRCP